MSEDGVARDDGGSGAIDRYLDDLFDALAGTGGAGRRALAEAEDHLRAAAADLIADGVPIEAAEREAVARFGAVARIASQLRRAHGRPRLPQLISAGWLLAGWTLGGLGATYLIKAVDIAVLLRMHPETVPECPDNLDQIMLDRLAAAPSDSVVEFGSCSTSTFTPYRSAGGHRRYSRYQLRLAARARDLCHQGTDMAAACRIINLEDQLEEARQHNDRHPHD